MDIDVDGHIFCVSYLITDPDRSVGETMPALEDWYIETLNGRRFHRRHYALVKDLLPVLRNLIELRI